MPLISFPEERLAPTPPKHHPPLQAHKADFDRSSLGEIAHLTLVAEKCVLQSRLLGSTKPKLHLFPVHAFPVRLELLGTLSRGLFEPAAEIWRKNKNVRTYAGQSSHRSGVERAGGEGGGGNNRKSGRPNSSKQRLILR